MKINKVELRYVFRQILFGHYPTMEGVVLTTEIVNVIELLLDMDNKEDADYFKNVVCSRPVMFKKSVR